MRKGISLIVSYVLMFLYFAIDNIMIFKWLRIGEKGVKTNFPSLTDMINNSSLIEIGSIRSADGSIVYWMPMIDLWHLVGYTVIGILLYFSILKIIDVVTKIKKREVVKNEN